MGWVSVLLGSLAAYLFYSADNLTLSILAGALTVVTFWSYGVMHNLTVEAAKRRLDYHGGFGEFTEADLPAVPSWLTNVNLGTSVLVLALLVWAGIDRWS